MKRRALPPAVALMIALAVVPAFGYLKLGTRVQTRTASLKWEDFPIRYFVTNRAASGVSADQFQAAITRAFATWDAVDTAETSSQFAGFTQANPTSGDGAAVLGFVNRPDLDRVLGATNFIIDVTTGEIVESDIFFNTSFPWSVAADGETGRHDLESIAVHEIGHLLGLGHSAIGETELVGSGRRVLGAEAVMFPIAFAAGTIKDRTLKEDDIAGITDIYPTSASRRSKGSITGKVTKNGAGVLGAHIVAFNPTSGALVGGFTLNDDGGFTIAGLEPGPHVLRVEPLDDGDIDSFFDATLNIDVNFRVRFHDRIIVVPQGGGASNVEIKGDAEMTVMRPFFLAVCFTAATAPAALGQVYLGNQDTPRRGSVEVTGGGAWSPGFDVQSVDAELTRGAQTDGFDLFSVSGDVSGFPGAYARLGFYLSSRISIEGGMRFAKPKLAYRLTGDAESAEDETAAETLSHYVFDGSVLFHLTNASFAGGRGVPFLSAGGGYIRELHEGNELVETGNEFHATAGVKYWFGSGRRRLGLRAEAGFSSRQKGLDDDEARRTLPLVLGGISLLF